MGSMTILIYHMRKGQALRNQTAKLEDKTQPMILLKTKIQTTTAKRKNQMTKCQRAASLFWRMKWHTFRAKSFIRERHCFTRMSSCNLVKSAPTASSSQFLCSVSALSTCCLTSLWTQSAPFQNLTFSHRFHISLESIGHLFQILVILSVSPSRCPLVINGL